MSDKKESIEIVVTYEDGSQQILTLKGVITHIQYDKMLTTNTFQLFIAEARNIDKYVRKPKEKKKT